MQVGNTLFVKGLFGTIAMEAPNTQQQPNQPKDLTTTTDDMMKSASGARADPGQFEPPTTSDETQAADGGNVDPNAMSDDIDSLEPGPGDETPEGGDQMDQGMGEMGEGEAAPMDDGTGEQTTQESPAQSFNIGKLHKNMVAFHGALTNTLSSLNDYTPTTTSSELTRIYNAAVDHLTNAKAMMVELLSDETTPANYVDKLRKYITLRHLYSTVLEMVNIHFTLLDEETGQETRQKR